jgi:hypothetical protein
VREIEKCLSPVLTLPAGIPYFRKRKKMNKELLIEALEIAISNFDYDQEWFKADELRDYRDQLKKESESK